MFEECCWQLSSKWLPTFPLKHSWNNAIINGNFRILNWLIGSTHHNPPYLRPIFQAEISGIPRKYPHHWHLGLVSKRSHDFATCPFLDGWFSMVEIPGCFFLGWFTTWWKKHEKNTHHISLYPISWMVYNMVEETHHSLWQTNVLLLKITILLMGKSTISTGPCSIAMLNYKTVSHYIPFLGWFTTTAMYMNKKYERIDPDTPWHIDIPYIYIYPIDIPWI